MKQAYLRSPLSTIAALLPLFVSAQTNKPEITFIKLKDNIGFVIDAVENEQYRCITYVSKKNFSYAALIQMPDSFVELRIKLVNQEAFRNVPVTEKDVADLYLAASKIITDSSVSDKKTEEELMRKLAGDTTPYQLINYKQLKFPIFPQYNSTSINAPSKVEQVVDSSNQHIFLNLGLGVTGSEKQDGYFSYGLELGLILKKTVLTMRYIGGTEPGGYLGDVQPHAHFHDFGLLCGRVFDAGSVVFTASAGVGYISGIWRGKMLYSTGMFGTIYYQSLSYSTIGIPVAAEMLVAARHEFNISVCSFVNINQENSHFGFLVCLRFGAAKNNLLIQ